MTGILTGKVALVTGASRGIGKATALALAKEGATVVVNYVKSAGPAEEVVKQIGSDRAVAIQADVSSVAKGKALIDKTVEKYGKIDFLILNAGLLFETGTLAATTEADFDKLYNANVKGPYFMLQAAVQHIPKGGRVVFFSTSLTNFSPITPNYLLYVSTKGAVEQLVRIASKDLGARGINVNCISPGPTGTDAFYDGKNPEIIKRLEGANPFGRLGEPDEIASMITVLCKPESTWVNGQNIRVNGGFTV